ncbi:MAG: hypothetical protein IM542_02755 [Pseudanabaena sp. M165S2SP1A06QC]|nr:hypothetical protein [Pseudanabaena sp. M165S2SP1A06QC]
MELSSSEQKELYDALLSAFPSFGNLKAMVFFDLEENLEGIAGSGILEDVVLNLLVWVKSRGKFQELIKAAYSSNKGNPKLEAIHQKYFLVSPQIANGISLSQWDEIKLVLADIDFELLQETCQATLANNIQNFEEKIPQAIEIKNLKLLQDILVTKYPLRKDGVPMILEFGERLICNEKVTEKDRLNIWLNKIASEKNINRPVYVEPKDTKKDIVDAYLMIVVEKNAVNFTLQAELIKNHQKSTKSNNVESISFNQDGLISCSENELLNYIGKFIKIAKQKLIKNYTLTIELFLPVKYLGRGFDLEEILADQNLKSPIGYEYRFAVRSLDRYLITDDTGMGDYLNKFEQRWNFYYDKEKKITNSTDHIQCLDSLEACKNWRKLVTDWNRNDKLVVNLAGGLTCYQNQEEFFYSLLRAGVPMSLWNRSPDLDCDHVKEKFSNLLTRDCLKNLGSLFQKIQDLRIDAHDEELEAKAFLGYHLGFLCDRPDRIPSCLKLEYQSLQGTD